MKRLKDLVAQTQLVWDEETVPEVDRTLTVTGPRVRQVVFRCQGDAKGIVLLGKNNFVLQTGQTRGLGYTSGPYKANHKLLSESLNGLLPLCFEICLICGELRLP